jgi:hypothetical protein
MLDCTLMPLALICSESPLLEDLSDTPLGRRDVERRVAVTLEEAQSLALHGRPSLIVVDRDVAWAQRLIKIVREQIQQRDVAVVVAARGAPTPFEKDLISLGADVILRLPGGTAWDEHIDRLLALPTRRDIRVPIQMHLDAQVGDDLVEATILNLGLRGMLIHCSVPLEMGQEIEFAFNVPEENLLITGSGRVARQASPTQYGVEFLRLEPEDRERLRRLVSATTIR